MHISRRELLLGGLGLAGMSAIAKPTRSAVASNGTRFSAIAKTPSASLYVQDGLVALWDGIENAGWGAHNSRATTWKDLIGGLTIPIDNGVEPLSVGIAKFAQSSSLTHIHDTYSIFYTCKFPNVAHKSSCIMMLPTTGTAGSVGFYSWNSDIPLCGFRTTNFRTMVAAADWPSDDMFCGQLGACYRLSKEGDAQSLNFALYLNGEEIYRALGATSYGVTTNGRLYINGTSNAALTQDVYSIKWYSRALTAAEIAANYAVDKQRFNLP